MGRYSSVDKIDSVAFIYLTQESGDYCVSNDFGHSVQRRPQLGLQYLCAVLEKGGVHTDIFDQTVTPFTADQLIERLRDYSMAGFYCSDAQEAKVKAYCRRIKAELNIPVLVGGPNTLGNTTFLDSGCDIVVHGEGEITIRDIIGYYNGKRDLKDIKGISYKDNDTVVTAPPQELIADLDELPFPDRSKVNLTAYYDYLLFGMKSPYITMIASRGCMYRCAFCTSCKIWGFKYRVRSVDNVLAEIDDCVDKYKIRYVAFQDDVFGIEKQWIEDFCRKLKKRPYKIRWMAIMHPFSMRKDTERLLRMMRETGCDTLSFGLQSAHPEILKNIHRSPSEPEQLKKILAAARKLGFITNVGYIFGLPGDTRDTVQTTIDYSLRCGATLVNYYSLSVLKGSEIEEKYLNKKLCSLSDEEIKRLTIYASRRFYANIKTLLNIAYFILKNPGWLVTAMLRMPSLLGRVGFGASTK